jgi:hypothetical protein
MVLKGKIRTFSNQFTLGPITQAMLLVVTNVYLLWILFKENLMLVGIPYHVLF